MYSIYAYICREGVKHMEPDSFHYHSDKIRNIGHQLKDWMSSLNIREQFFTIRVTGHRQRFLREVAESPCLEFGVV